MFWEIVIKEIQDHLKSLRLMLTFLLLIGLMIVSAVLFIPEYHQQMADYSQSRSEILEKLSQNAEKRGAIFHVFSWNYAGKGPWSYKKPNHLAFISEGHGRDLPNAFNPSAFKIYGPEKRIRSNMLLWRSEFLDWAFIIGFILSFASLILMYDAVSGEREQGTLRLNLSNPLPRSILILAKFSGAWLCLSSALLVGILIHLVILIVVGNIPVVGMDWAIIGLTYVLSVLYVSIFLMLGLFISSLSRESATSLVVSILCWALLVVVIPRAGGFIASKITHLPIAKEVDSNASLSEGVAQRNYDEKYPEVAGASKSGHWSPGEPLERAFVCSDAWSKVIDEYRNKMIHQVEVAQKVTFISPFSCFRYGLEVLTESGIFHYKRFFRQVQNYKLTMRQFLIDQYPVPLKWWGWSDGWARKIYDIKLDFNSIPKFEEERTAITRIIIYALPCFLLLVLFNALFFTGAYVSFMKYDVR